jgi:uncharacterized membrane protein
MTASTDHAPAKPARRSVLRRVPAWIWVSLGAFASYAGLSIMMLQGVEGSVRFAPRAEPLLRANGFIQVHASAAMLTFFIGCVLLLSPKGRTFHRTLGWTWVLTMAVTAISSFFLRGLMGDSLSPIHALSAWTLIGLPMGLAAARRHNITAHRKQMTGMFTGGMLVAGLFTFLPGRLMWHTLFQIS